MPLDDAVRNLVAERTGALPAGPVRVLAHVLTFGDCFNPVCFYFCFAEGPGRLEALVADVTNTPWGERNAYVFHRREARGRVIGERLDKAFHVSPFMGMNDQYDVRVTEPGEELVVHIESIRENARAFDATLFLRRRGALTPGALDRLLLRHLLDTLRTVTLIYANALKLTLEAHT